MIERLIIGKINDNHQHCVIIRAVSGGKIRFSQPSI